ncbi:MAG: YicC family protein [Desulfuromonadales bacterium]
MALKSMTGYGKGEARQADLTVTVEIKTVNHRYSDVNVKLPRTFLSHENSIRKQVAAALGRGKIDVYVNYELAGDIRAVPKINRDLAAAYHRLFAEMVTDFGLSGTVCLEHMIGQKDVVQVEETTIDPDLLEHALDQATAAALTQLLTMREAEGEEIRRDLAERLDLSETILADIEVRAPLVPQEWQVRLTERLERLQQSVDWDPQRIAQEIAVFSDRCDISEEVTRFKSHLVQFRGLFAETEPVGRRMDFLVQELNREVNTMGSKANDATLTRAVVDLKSELEKIREQVQNIE